MLRGVNISGSLFILISIISMPYISALCNEGQIDINNANAEELDGLVGVGPVIAQNIINARPYQTLDDLVNAKGIGATKLANIKSQRLACVKDEESNKKDTGSKEKDDGNEDSKDNEDVVEGINKQEKISEGDSKLIENNKIGVGSEEVELKPLEPIVLSAQSIKTDENKDNYKNRLPVYGFIGFFILILVLFLLRKERFKNEFR